MFDRLMIISKTDGNRDAWWTSWMLSSTTCISRYNYYLIIMLFIPIFVSPSFLTPFSCWSFSWKSKLDRQVLPIINCENHNWQTSSKGWILKKATNNKNQREQKTKAGVIASWEGGAREGNVIRSTHIAKYKQFILNKYFHYKQIC